MKLKVRRTILSKYIKKALANVGPKGEPIETPSTSLQSFPLKVKQDFFVARDKSFLNSSFKKCISVNVTSLFKWDISKKRINI